MQSKLFLRIIQTIFMLFVECVAFPCFAILWFIYLVYKYLSILELKGWKSPPSSWKFLKVNEGLEPLDFPGICSFLQSSLYLEKLVIDWYNYKKKRHAVKVHK